MLPTKLLIYFVFRTLNIAKLHCFLFLWYLKEVEKRKN
jgi:hypothetical protein